MALRSNLPLLMVRATIERQKQQQPKLTLERMADESGVAVSVLASLNTNKQTRIAFQTIERLLEYFNRYFPTEIGDLLVWERDQAAGGET
jgi:DNA-binding Xre family transcriptional regulator